MGRLLAIGDIHGNIGALDAILDAVAPAADDTLVLLGDYVNGHLFTAEVLDRVVELVERVPCVSLLGNHDDMMLAAIDSPEHRDVWLGMGGRATIESYPHGSFDDVPDAHVEFLRSCSLWHETESLIFVHAGVVGSLAMEQQPREVLLWRRLEDSEAHRSGKTVICGHSRQKSGKPVDRGHTVCIDTGAKDGAWLSCLDCDKWTMWQADDHGKVRKRDIPERGASASGAAE